VGGRPSRHAMRARLTCAQTLKILGALAPADAPGTPPKFDMHAPHPLRVSAACHRVAVLDGHTMSLSVRFARRPPPSPSAVRDALRGYAPDARALGCPSAPSRAVYVHDAPDRPQPRLDRERARGAGIDVGRVRECAVLDVKLALVVNNVAIGAATSSIINAELAIAKGLIVV
jgi:aspartate-semialdehyde dehydrogenase